MRTLADKFELATESIINNFYKFGYEIDAVVENDTPTFKVISNPTNYPELRIDTICIDGEGVYYFEATLTFTNVVLKSEFADDIEADLKKLAELGKVVTRLNTMQFDPMEWEED